MVPSRSVLPSVIQCIVLSGRACVRQLTNCQTYSTGEQGDGGKGEEKKKEEPGGEARIGEKWKNR